ncbi:Transmembrane emp24 protein transport domain containing 5 [Trichostrongylus colubriformis]|uniref:Transmembrane emp24 protein transport domain containing 5 n=1 Tax=Trichostrongylus colubriformis TaxID=6319 RepID=A0AAN8F8R4_TRICO
MRALSILFLIGLAASLEQDFTIEVPPGKFQCYFQPVDTTKHKFMEIDYQVVDGGDLNINFMILLGANVLVQEERKVDGSHRLDIKQAGDYQFCFDNSFSYQSRKVVFFEVFLMNEQGQLDEIDYAKASSKDDALEKKMEELGVTIAGFRDSANHIKSQLNKIEYNQALLRAHEARDRAVMGANLDRVTFWSCTHTLVMLCVAALQVFLIRSLFEDNSKVGRLLRKGNSGY